MSTDFDSAIALEREPGTADGGSVWSGELASGWQTPRGPLGGYVMAIVINALDLEVGDPQRQARAVTMHFLRVPEAGPVRVLTATERRGRSLTSVSGRLEQDGKLIGIALGAWSAPWDGPLLDNAPAPDAAPSDPSGAGDHPRGEDAPEFAHRLRWQHRFGEAPFTGAAEGLSGGWIGLTEERPIDAAAIAVMADAWLPAPWPMLTAFAPAPTIDLTIHFRSPLPAPGQMLLGRFRSDYVREGFFDESGELWDETGTLVAQSRQLGLLLGATEPVKG